MNKADRLLICLIVLLAGITYIPVLTLKQSDSDIAVVYYREQEILRVDLHENREYRVEGTLGEVIISVKDGKVAVTQENSPYHLCSLQGYVSSAAEPIVCLPNEIVVSLETQDEEVDVMIQ